MPFGLPVVPDVYRMNSGCSAGNASGSCSVDWPSTSSCHHTSLSPQAMSMPVRLTTRTCSIGLPSVATASSTAAFNDTADPRRYWPSAVMISRASASAILVRSASAEKPPKMTEWASPSRAQASIEKTASGIIGR